ncbi:MAG: ABC transporter ATP-binding protein [Acidimicrobiales bacterium]
MTTEAVLEIRRLHVTFDLDGGRQLRAVRGVTLRLAPGERLGLVGESGCGKSTAVLATMGLLPASAVVAGEVRLEGADILAGGEGTLRPHRWRDLAMVFQGGMNSFNPVRTVGEQIAEPMRRLERSPRREARERVGALLELVGIPAARADLYPHELSGGMRQRAAIAMALACSPKVLLADEPTTALDVMVQAQILALLGRLADELGLAVVLVSHDLPAVGRLCGRVAVMYAGRIVEEGPTDQLYADPLHPYTRLLFAATPDLRRREAVASIPGAPPRLDRPIAGCAFLPRCDRADEGCAAAEPAPVRVGAARSAACRLVTHA